MAYTKIGGIPSLTKQQAIVARAQAMRADAIADIFRATGRAVRRLALAVRSPRTVTR